VTEFRVIEEIEGIKIVPDIGAAPGIDTLEGRIGPLLNATRGGAHFIEIPAGAYMNDHAHETESLIYTVRGDRVLCSRGQRWHMRTGSLFWFGDGIPTGYENPFDTSACILIFKTSDRTPGYDASMLERVRDIAAKLEDEHKSGTPFLFRELQPDHPARQFSSRLGLESA
jgi:quercetin dioxygenase-like cupin family protein